MNNTCPKCSSPIADEQTACQSCGAALSHVRAQSGESARKSFVKQYGQRGSRGKISWWGRQPKRTKIGIIAGSMVLVALLVILPFWSSWFPSGDVRTLNITQQKQLPLKLEAMEYISSPRNSSRVAVRFSVWGNYAFSLGSAVVVQGQERHAMITSDASGSGSLRWICVAYFDHFDIARASKIEVTLRTNRLNVDYVFEIPPK